MSRESRLTSNSIISRRSFLQVAGVAGAAVAAAGSVAQVVAGVSNSAVASDTAAPTTADAVLRI